MICYKCFLYFDFNPVLVASVFVVLNSLYTQHKSSLTSCYFLCAFPIKVYHVTCVSVFWSGDFIIWLSKYVLQVLKYDRKDCEVFCNSVGELHWAEPTECRLVRAIFWGRLVESYPQSYPRALMWTELADFLQRKTGEQSSWVTSTWEIVQELSTTWTCPLRSWCDVVYLLKDTVSYWGIAGYRAKYPAPTAVLWSC